MNDFLFRMPTKVMFGVGAAKKVPGLCKEMGFSRLFVVTGSTSTGKSVHLQEMLAAKGIVFKVRDTKAELIELLEGK